ncbi:hypothetical protein, partial [Priestia megaterium]|uniref:hypothetical protein n=1 Tax=Priestia megaterium TaxID=1404 RepID=UPI002FFDF2B7
FFVKVSKGQIRFSILIPPQKRGSSRFRLENPLCRFLITGDFLHKCSQIVHLRRRKIKSYTKPSKKHEKDEESANN